jgi:polysaccharide export outer membrane protein
MMKVIRTAWLAMLTMMAVSIAGAAWAQAGDADPAGDAPGVGPDYVIGPGDTLNVFVWRNPELTVVVPVRPDGKISTPLVEDMVAVGKTPAQLARDIETVLAEYVKQPQVNIIVQNPVSRFSQVKIVGQVARPAPVPYRDGMTVLDAVLEVGGLTPFAAGNRAKRGELNENVQLLPGDVIVIPESRF